MRKIIIIAAALVAAFLCSNAFALEGKVVEIRIEGAKRVDAETIKSYLATKVGDRYFPQKVREDIKNIYAQGFFSDVRVEGEQTADGVVLIYHIEEKPLVKSVKFSGNDKISDDDIQEVIEVKERQVLEMPQVRDTEKAISQLYQKQGYFLAEITTEIEPAGDGQVKVEFKIQEKGRVIVKDIVFLGNEAFDDKELQTKVATQPSSAITFLTQKGYFQQEEFDLDIARLTFWYYDNGYIKVQIPKPQVFLSPDKRYITVVFKITEGPQYMVGKVDIKGDLIRPKEELMARLVLKTGNPYSATKLRKDIEGTADYYADFGYADANVVPQSKIDDEAKTVDVTYFIRKGIKVYIERIDITGNDKTRDMVIRRMMKIKEGELYSATAIKRSETAIMRLGFFKQVKIVPRPGDRPEMRRLTVMVEETTTGSISAGAGYSSNEEFTVTGQISQQNLMGRGQNLSLSIFWGSETQNFNVSFSDPYFLDSRWSFKVNTYVYMRQFVNFDRRDAGGSIAFGHLLPRSDFSRIYLSYMYQDTLLSDFPSSRAILTRIPLDSSTSSLTFSFDRNTTNNYLDPSDGMELLTSVEYAGRFLGGENDFTKYTAKLWFYQPVWKGTYFGFRATAGIMDQDQDDRLLLSERYYLGGINDMRGFKNRSLGPRFPSDNPAESDLIIGGNKQLVFSVDYIIPLVKRMGIKGVLFADAGNAFNDNEDFDLGNLRYDWGFGIRWISPLGPLRFELGFPIDPKEDEESRVFQFSVGAPMR